MKVKVIRKFRDKYTGEVYQRGQVLEINEARYREIMLKGNFVFKIADDAQSVSSGATNILSSDEAETPSEASVTPDDGFELMTVRELKEYADKTYKMTFANGTKKAEIIEALRRMEHGK